MFKHIASIMRVSNFPFSTLKESPADAEIVSHILMLRAGMIRKLAAGLYTWLPMGLRVLRKVENIIREEMDASGAIEVLMPSVIPAELWQESDRWDQYGPELLRMRDRHNREFCYGPTHEEVITDLVRREVRSYKQLPVNYYQIQTKFRDEIRPRFGVMRAREFSMKDAYSFHISKECLETTYQVMYQTYSKIFERLDLEFRAVEADTGSIGGSSSHEFHVLAESGEDAIAFSNNSNYAANVELAPNPAVQISETKNKKPLEKIATPNQHTIQEVCAFMNVAQESVAKTLIVKSDTGSLTALVLRGDHELNAVKAEKLPNVASPLQFANDQEIRNSLDCSPGSIGPLNLKCPTIIDHAAWELNNFVCGANEDGFHMQGANWKRDLENPSNTRCEDLRNIVEGDPSPDGQGTIIIKRGIEVGHIFQLGEKYSKALNATVLGKDGKEKLVTMGCYGIGVTRVVAAAIEQNYDNYGIIWPTSIAPFTVSLIPINLKNSTKVGKVCEEIYHDLTSHGFEVLFDDRDIRAGLMFADHELVGIPHRIVVSEKNIEKGLVEYKARQGEQAECIKIENLLSFIKNNI